MSTKTKSLIHTSMVSSEEVGEEAKTKSIPLTLKDTTLSAKALAALRGVSRRGGVLELNITLTDSANLSSNGSGLLAANFSATPTGFADWSAFAALFNEVKLVSYELQLVNNFTTATLLRPPVGVGFFPEVTATPTGYSGVMEGRPNLFFSSQSSETVHKIKMEVPKGLGWALTSAPTPGVWAGCPGNFQCVMGPVTNSTIYLYYTVRAVYRLRGRV